VRFALTEGPGLLLVALAVAAIERGRPWLASGLMALIGLGRETNFIAGGLLVDRVPRRRPDALGVAARGAADERGLHVLVVRSRWFWPLVIAGNLTVFHGIHMIKVPWLAAIF
jgi:hypothetical protein